MHYFLTSAVFLYASLSLAENTPMGNYYAPGRAERMFNKRAPRDFGTFQVDCQGSESACNNACYYIRCQARNYPDANKITYIGPNGNNGEGKSNRIESGCNFNNPSSGSVCTNFPFSQKFSDKLATDWQCDEWPPAMSQQTAFGSPNRIANSLRCMVHNENESLGGKLGNFVVNNGMSRDDFFRVDFTTKIGTADQTKVGFCLGAQPNCGNDGMQFGMTAKPVGGGKISSAYNIDGNDNLYALQNTVYRELYQCQVKFTRAGDQTIQNVILADWQNHNVQTSTGCTLANNGNTCTLNGLPNDLQITRTGNLGSKIDFEYAPGQAGTNVNNFAWDSDMSGNGRGPWTDPQSDPNRQPLRFCKVVDGSAPNTQDFECWFPCYENANGR